MRLPSGENDAYSPISAPALRSRPPSMLTVYSFDMKSSPRELANRTDRESGVQLSTTSSAEWNVNCLACPPSDGTMYTSRLPLRSLEKAIHLPSGENRG